MPMSTIKVCFVFILAEDAFFLFVLNDFRFGVNHLLTALANKFIPDKVAHCRQGEDIEEAGENAQEASEYLGAFAFVLLHRDWLC